MDPWLAFAILLVLPVVWGLLSLDEKARREKVKAEAAQASALREAAHRDEHFAKEAKLPVDIERDIVHRSGLEDVRLNARTREVEIDLKKEAELLRIRQDAAARDTELTMALAKKSARAEKAVEKIRARDG